MQTVPLPNILLERRTIASAALNREVLFDCYFSVTPANHQPLDLVLINDGQILEEMAFPAIIENYYKTNHRPTLFVGIHAGPDRKHEYGIARFPDYKGRGDKASSYTLFIVEELLPALRSTYGITGFGARVFAGFSLGGLTALDIVWNHPHLFNIAGVFSGSLWWRSLAQEDNNYSDDKHRIMHQRIRSGEYKPGLRFYFQCGNKDETKDRNNNGIIDSIDDTMDLIKELEAKGYKNGVDIQLELMEDGRHDAETWGKAMPHFLDWMCQF